MSDSRATFAPRGPAFQGLRLETLVIAAVCVIVLAAGWYLLAQRQQTLRSSPSGLDGLQIWLASNGVGAQNFSGGWLMDQTSVGLLIVPIYDTLLNEERKAPTTKEELLAQQDEYDFTASAILTKVQKVPALLVLPKWRSGMRLTGLAHPVLNIETTRLKAIVKKLTGDSSFEPVSARAPFTTFSYRSQEDKDLNAEIYSAQMFRSNLCTPLLGTKDAMILAECPLKAGSDAKGEKVLVLSDPDLVNNHGLRLGDNATIALNFLRSKAGQKNIVIDYSRSNWLRDPSAEPRRERSWDDLRRFFGPPFLTLWIGAALVLGLFLWRSALRYGPIRSYAAAPGEGKNLAVRARARLMRMSGQDGALVGDYADARLSATADALLGRVNAHHYASEDGFLKFADRRHPDQAAQLRAVLSRIRQSPARLPASEAIQLIDELEQVLEQITNDA
ncbi:hypothetical protein [uncultured Roseibium sp.]|uniref:hypothetical protein n=1 Tax=uncultured Roseibium sp. TaxID=1936171 RepID=UPI0032177772